jgi:hypothetical protein
MWPFDPQLPADAPRRPRPIDECCRDDCSRSFCRIIPRAAAVAACCCVQRNIRDKFAAVSIDREYKRLFQVTFMFMMLRLEILRPGGQIPHRRKSFGAINAREPTFNPWSSRFVCRFASCPLSSGGPLDPDHRLERSRGASGDCTVHNTDHRRHGAETRDLDAVLPPLMRRRPQTPRSGACRKGNHYREPHRGFPDFLSGRTAAAAGSRRISAFYAEACSSAGPRPSALRCLRVDADRRPSSWSRASSNST